jgi:hypothetical protein
VKRPVVTVDKIDTGEKNFVFNPETPAFVRQSERNPIQSSHVSRPEVNIDTDPHFLLHKQMVDAINLPNATIMTFAGEPIQFWLFINSFDSSVGNTSVDDGAKLNRLLQYCTGKAAKVIQPCALMPPSEGFAKARKLLRERFGNDYTISEAWVRKVTECAPIRSNDGESLQDYADDVMNCVETLRAMGKLEEIDNRTKMVKIVERLPFYLSGRWRKEAVNTLDRSGHYPGIAALSSFLSRASKELNDTVFGSVHDKQKGERVFKSKPNAPLLRKRGASFNVHASGSANRNNDNSKPGLVNKDSVWQPTCYFCGKAHRLRECCEFKKMSVQRRLDIVKEKRLCFNCMGSRNHVASECKMEWRCNVDGCGKKHSSLLHSTVHPSTLSSRDKDETERKSVDDSAKGFACGPSQVDARKVALPIVVVNVKGSGQDNYIRALALLDPGSNRTFCSTTLLDELGLDREKTTLSLETLTEGKDANASVISLEVTGTSGKLNRRKVVKLPRVYALSRFPSLKGSVADPSDVRKWDHLRDINIPQMRHLQETNVAILIGQDVPEALLPLEVIEGDEGEPYAVRTLLGWTLNGPLSEQSSEIGGIANFVQADVASDIRLETQVEKCWKLDTEPVLAGSVPQMSQEDRQVIELWDNTVGLDEGHYVMDIPFKSQSRKSARQQE